MWGLSLFKSGLCVILRAMVTQKVETLADALAVIRELTQVMDKQAELIAQQAEELRSYKSHVEKLTNELSWLKRQVFGSKNEKFLPETEGTSLLPGLEAPETEVPEIIVQKVSEHERKVREKNGWEEIPEGLPREERILDVPEEKREGMELIGYEESERVAYRSGLYVIHFKRSKYADKRDPNRGVVTASAPGDYFDSPSGKTKFDISFAGKVVSDKVENALPLDRQAKIYEREGFPVSPSTLGHLFKNCASALVVLYARMIELIMKCEILHVDETYLKLNSQEKRGKCKKAYFWCRMTGIGPPMIAFHFSNSRSQEVANELLGDYFGTIIRDSYVGYEKLKHCTNAACWAHARRRFFLAFQNGYRMAEEPLTMIRDLYKIESAAKKNAEEKGTETALFQARKKGRRDSEKIVKDFFGLCRDLRESQIPSSPVAEAATYVLNIEKELKEFLENPKVNIDNNPAEAMQRAVSIGRRNWLFTGSEAGGQNLAILYSFSNTCKANDVNFRNWIEDVLPRLNSTSHDQIDSLLPHLWKQQNNL